MGRSRLRSAGRQATRNDGLSYKTASGLVGMGRSRFARRLDRPQKTMAYPTRQRLGLWEWDGLVFARRVDRPQETMAFPTRQRLGLWEWDGLASLGGWTGHKKRWPIPQDSVWACGNGTVSSSHGG